MIEGIQENIVVKVDSEADVDESAIRARCEELLYIHYGRRLRVKLVEKRGDSYVYEPIGEIAAKVEGVIEYSVYKTE